jgi:hypothetical protein
MRNLAAKILSCVLVLAVPSMLFAETNASMMYGAGNVQVNGTAMPKSAAVFTGDKIQTGAGSAATLTSSGSTVVIAANSSVVFQGSAVELNSGVALVNTTKGMQARVNKISVTPASKGTAKFEVTRANGRVLIAAREGAIAVFDGNTNAVVAEGSSTLTPDPVPGKAPGALGMSAKQGLSAGAAVGIGATVAAVAAIMGATTTNAPKPASPSQP